MDVLLLFIVPVSIVILYQITAFSLYKLQTHFTLKGFYPNKSMQSIRYLPINEIIESVKLLYTHGIIHKIFINDEYISFEDRGC
jgi:hypothetical protein